MSATTAENSTSSAARTWRVSATHHLGLTVSDLERSLRFYCDVLGFQCLSRRVADAPYIAQQTGFAGAALNVASLGFPGNSGVTLEMAQYLNHPAPVAGVATNRPACAHICLVVDDLPALYDDLHRQGVKFKSPPVAITSGPNQGGSTLYLYDPDGFVVELFQPPRR
jgi:catechol 2,3-dioxygenase-like lactoylglutathione lyase family enzyme